MTQKIFDGDGRIHVSAMLRDEIREAYERAGWPSSRHAAAAAAELGESVSHQTIESFLSGRWVTTDKRVLRALIAIHDLDEDRLAVLAAADVDEEWLMPLPRRLWPMSPAGRERVRLAVIAMLDAAHISDEMD